MFVLGGFSRNELIIRWRVDWQVVSMIDLRVWWQDLNPKCGETEMKRDHGHWICQRYFLHALLQANHSFHTWCRVSQSWLSVQTRSKCRTDDRTSARHWREELTLNQINRSCGIMQFSNGRPKIVQEMLLFRIDCLEWTRLSRTI